MELTSVTLTGIDTSTDLNALVEISKQYPFVEWGVLVSKSAEKKYPSWGYVKDCANLMQTENISFAAHLCGDYARSVVTSNFLESDIFLFPRIQLNVNFWRTPNVKPYFYWHREQYILQYNKNNSYYISSISENVNDFLYEPKILFDSSGGRGVKKRQWKEPLKGFSCGYSGGIGIDNIEESIETILEFKSDVEFWIDMEKSLRDEKIGSVLTKLRLS